MASTPYGGGPELRTMAAGAAPRRRTGAARAARCQPAGLRPTTCYKHSVHVNNSGGGVHVISAETLRTFSAERSKGRVGS